MGRWDLCAHAAITILLSNNSWGLIAQLKSSETQISLVVGDITKQRVDAIVNASNEALWPGGGVDRAIHGAAGKEFTEATRRIGGCPTGEARIVGGYNLWAKYVIHTVGPRYGEHGGNEAKLLRSCILNSLMLANECHISSIAFPLISTGTFKYPLKEAIKVMADAAAYYLKNENDSSVKEIIIVALNEADAPVLEEAISRAKWDLRSDTEIGVNPGVRTPTAFRNEQGKLYFSHEHLISEETNYEFMRHSQYDFFNIMKPSKYMTMEQLMPLITVGYYLMCLGYMCARLNLKPELDGSLSQIINNLDSDIDVSRINLTSNSAKRFLAHCLNFGHGFANYDQD